MTIVNRPLILRDEAVKKKINKLVLVKRTMNKMDKFLIEDIKYRVDIKNPLCDYDHICIDTLSIQYLGGF
jgi:hypothetical protein